MDGYFHADPAFTTDVASIVDHTGIRLSASSLIRTDICQDITPDASLRAVGVP